VVVVRWAIRGFAAIEKKTTGKLIRTKVRYMTETSHPAIPKSLTKELKPVNGHVVSPSTSRKL